MNANLPHKALCQQEEKTFHDKSGREKKNS